MGISVDDFSLFRDFLAKESGLYFSDDKSGSLSRCLDERIKEAGLSSYREYYDLLRHPLNGIKECNALFKLITVGETCFFRYPAQFQVLREHILPEIIKEKSLSSKSIKIWSAGCSTGEEAYTIAICLLETIRSFDDWQVRIFATDINSNVLDRAKEAVYSQRAIRNVPQEYLDKYFIKKAGRFILKEEVKKIVNFSRHNMAKDPFLFFNQGELDIIFCRNVIIYFGLSAIKKVINEFCDSLKEGGYLFLGDAEILLEICDGFQAVDFMHAFAYRKKIAQAKKTSGLLPLNLPEFNLKKPLHAGPGKPEKEGYNFLPADFEKAILLSNQAKYAEAISELKKIIDKDSLLVEARYLLGVLFYKTGEIKEAIKEFKRVIYINPDIVISYYNLGNIYLVSGEYEAAKREFRNALRILGGKPNDETVVFSETITGELLAMACNKNLEHIK